MTMTTVQTPSEFRQLCKQNKFTSNTSGYVPGYAQANVLILPKELADDFINLCERNPVPCPLLAKTELGFPNKLNNNQFIKTDNDNDDEDDNFDLRTDLPKYKIFRNSKFIKEVDDISKYWDLNDHIGFLIGCSFSFENELIKSNLKPKNILLNSNVSMYITKKMLNSSGVFINCPYVVSMRPYKLKDIEKVRDITRNFKKTHGEPIDWGYDAIERLGINDINNPEFGDKCKIDDDEIPVFWACGVTTQVAALTASKNCNSYTFSHSPGHMLILDIKDSDINNL